MSNTVKLAGVEQRIARLNPLQVAAFLDEMTIARNGETRVATFTRSLRIIFQGLKNAENPLVAELDEENGIVALNALTTHDEVTPAFRAVMVTTGLVVTQANAAADPDPDSASVEPAA